MAHFAYIGDHEETECFGLRFPRDEAVGVNDASVAAKLANNRDFVPVHDGVQVLDAPKRRGRPPKER